MRYMCCSPPSNRWDDLFKVALSLLEARELLLLVRYFSKKKNGLLAIYTSSFS